MLNKFVRHIKRLSSKSDKDGVIEYINNYANEHNLDVVTERTSVLPRVETVNPKEEFTLIAKKYDSVILDSDTASSSHKEQISTKEDIDRVYVRMRKGCINVDEHTIALNGVVLNSNDWNVLSRPFDYYEPADNSIISSRFSEFKIYAIRDATVINLYNYNDVWCISTYQGYDVSELKWFGDLTYSEIIFDLLTKLMPEYVNENRILIENKRLVIPHLNKAYCYTLGFKHHNFHPILTDPEKIFFIKSTRLIDGADGIDIPEMQHETDITNQFTNFDEVVEYNSNSIRMHIRKGIHNYGFLFVSDNEKYILPSNLLNFIEENIYSIHSHIVKKLSSGKKLKFNFMKLYLDNSNRLLCEKMFPQTKLMFQDFDLSFMKLIDRIMEDLRYKARYGTYSATQSSKLITASQFIIDDLERSGETFGAFSGDTPSIIRDFLMNTSYAYIMTEYVMN